ncbi:MAG: hypothetical protein ACLFUI_06555 [Halanaerobiales bacterium]
MTRREKILLVFAVVLISLLFGVKMIFLPLLDSYFAFNKEYSDIEYQLEKVRLQLKSTDKYMEQLNEVSKEGRLLEEYFYQGDPAEIRLEILNYLDGRIREWGLVAESKELFIERTEYPGQHPGNTQELDYEFEEIMEVSQIESGLQEIEQLVELREPVKLSYRAQIKGDYQQLLSLIEDITTYHKYYSIRQLDLKLSSDQSQLAVFIVIESYCIEGDNGV